MRSKINIVILAIAGLMMTGCPAEPAARPDIEPWTEGARYTGRYRNMFAEAGYSQQEIDAKVAKAFYDVFEGPDRVYQEVGDDMAWVSDVKNNDVRTEGMSYGMMVAVQFDKKDMFDRLWRWSKKYMQHQEGPRKGYFAWSLKTSGVRNAEGPASDGELYFVTALIFASNRWGNDTGIDYLAEARHILDSSFEKTGADGVEKLINTEHKLITFVPDTNGYHFTDPSYHVPSFFEVWAEWAGDGRADFWRECAERSREFLHKAAHPVTSLTSDYTDYEGNPIRPGFHPADEFHYDSWRVPMNIAIDYSWYCKDREWQQKYADNLQRFLYGEGVSTFLDQYALDGSVVKDTLQAGGYKTTRHSIGFVGTAAAVSLAATQNIAWEFIDELWNARLEPYADGYYDGYYDGLLYLFSLMHLSGKYQIILPQ